MRNHLLKCCFFVIVCSQQSVELFGLDLLLLKSAFTKLVTTISVANSCFRYNLLTYISHIAQRDDSMRWGRRLASKVII